MNIDARALKFLQNLDLIKTLLCKKFSDRDLDIDIDMILINLDTFLSP